MRYLVVLEKSKTGFVEIAITRQGLLDVPPPLVRQLLPVPGAEAKSDRLAAVAHIAAVMDEAR